MELCHGVSEPSLCTPTLNPKPQLALICPGIAGGPSWGTSDLWGLDVVRALVSSSRFSMGMPVRLIILSVRTVLMTTVIAGYGNG